MYFSRSNLNISTVRYFCHLSKDYHHKETKFFTYISNNKRGPLKTRKKIVTNLYNAFSWFKKMLGNIHVLQIHDLYNE